MLQLRAGSSSFSFDELKKAVDYTHSLGKKLYVTVNCFANNDEIPLVGAYGAELLEIGVDAVIVSDLVTDSAPNKPCTLRRGRKPRFRSRTEYCL